MAKVEEIVAVFVREWIRFPSGDVAMVEARRVSDSELLARETNKPAPVTGESLLLEDSAAGTTGLVLATPEATATIETDDALALLGLGEGQFDDGASVDDTVNIKVECEPGELIPDQEYLWLGKWFDHRKYGLQFHATSFVLRQPHGRNGVIAYLTAAGEGNNFGKAKAAKCWDLYGSGAVLMMRKKPLDVVEALGRYRLWLKEEQALAIAKVLEEQALVEACNLDLLDVLAGKGFPKNVAKACIQQWGVKASQIVRRDPYKLMRFKGCGFRRCDAVYLELGLDPRRLKRQALAAWYAVASNSDGHTWFPMSVAVVGIKKYIGSTKLDTDRAILLALGRYGKGRLLSKQTTRGPNGPLVMEGKTARSGFEWVAETPKSHNEADLATMIVEANNEQNTWPRDLW